MSRTGRTTRHCSSGRSPHASQYPKLLTGSGNEICFDCHGDKQSSYEGSAHFKNPCVGCHNPHGSQYSPILLNTQPDLCYHCHPTIDGTNKHPVRPKYYDLHAKVGLMCTTTCHNPHGTEYDFMMRNYDWKQDGLCLQCHKTVGVYY